jgi:hypothetical protein
MVGFGLKARIVPEVLIVRSSYSGFSMYVGTDMPLQMADMANYKPIGIEAHLCFASFEAELRDCSVIW